jgi:hypothetical protein
VSSAARHPIAEEAGATDRPQRDEAAAAATSGAGRWTASARERVVRWLETPAAFDIAACLVYLAFAFWLTHGLWPHPATRALAENVNDQALNEWFLAHGVTFWTGDFSLVTDRMNAPDGVNLMSNASNILYSITMAPVTALFGVAVTFTVLMAVNLAATATGWYLLLARALGVRRGAALVGGAVAGFAPGMISQSESHIHMTAQWLVPPIVYCVIRLTRVTTNRATVLTGLGLGLLVCAQLFVGEEVLFLTALTLALFSVTYVIRRGLWFRQIAPRFLAGMAVATGLALVLLAYPLWVQFQGPQHTPNAPFEARFFYADVATYFLFSPLSIAGSPDVQHLSTSSAEFNSYLGLPLILVVMGVLVWRWRSPMTIAIGVTMALIAWLSLGPTVYVEGKATTLPGLYSHFNNVPVISAALPTRYALVLIPLIGVLLAYAIDAAVRIGGFAKFAVPVAVIAALLPSVPLPLAATSRKPVPQFITTGAWRQCAPDGGVMVLVPAPTPRTPDLLRWAATANAAFAIPEGFFIGPYAAGGRSSLGIYPRPTSQLLTKVAETGQVPTISDGDRDQARADLNYWKADCVALAPVANEPALRATLEQLLGPGQPIDDTWTWKINRSG